MAKNPIWLFVLVLAIGGCYYGDPLEKDQTAGQLPEESVRPGTAVSPDGSGALEVPYSEVDPGDIIGPKAPEQVSTPESIARQWEIQAKAEYTAGNFEAANTSLRQAIRLDPQNRLYTFRLGHVMTTQAQSIVKTGEIKRGYAVYVEVATLFREIGLNNPKFTPEERQFVSNAVYNEACAYALNGETAKALAVLRESVEVGFHDLNLMQTDADLKSLHGLPEFKALLEESRRRLEQRAKEEVRELFANSEPIPFDFDLPDADDKKLSLGQLKGKVVLAHIWATQCPYCEREVPNYIALQKKFGEQGLQVVGLTFEMIPGNDTRQSIRDFVAKSGINYPCLLGDAEVKRQVLNHRVYPIAFFIDRTGVTRIRLNGNQPYVKLETIVTTLLAEAAPNVEPPAKAASGD